MNTQSEIIYTVTFWGKFGPKVTSTMQIRAYSEQEARRIAEQDIIHIIKIEPRN
jgi:hypothetical protein